MATPPEIKVRITGDSSGLAKEAAKAKKSVQDLAKESKTASTQIAGASKSVGQANNTLLEFGRIVQDAPFGIRGIGNNITQLATNFGSLSAQSGGAGAALKAVGASFLGPQGIIIAISTAVSLLTVYGDKLFSASQKTNELTRATLDFAADAKTEITILNELIKIVGDEAASRQKRAEAVEILQKKYPEYLKNLSLENSTTKEIKTSVDELTKSIELRARVQGAQELITQKAREALEKQAKAQEQYEKSIKNIPQSLQRAQQANQSYARGLGATSQDVFDVGKNEARQREIVQDRLDKSLAASEKDYQDYVKNLQSILGNTDDLFGALGTGPAKIDTKKVEDKLKKAISDLEIAESIIDREKAAENAADVARIYEESGARVKDALKGVGDSLNDGIEQTFLKIRQIEDVLASLKSKVSPDTFDIISTFNIDQLKAFQAELAATQTQAKVFSDAVGAGFQGLALQMTQTISTGSAVLDALVASIVNSLASIAAAFIQQAITDKIITTQNIAQNLAKSNANAITIATSAAAALGPLGAAALPGLIASQLAIVNGAFAGIAAAASFAQGGIVPGGSFVGDKVPAYLNSGEMILNTGQQTRLFDILNGNLGRMQNDNRNTSMEVFGVIRGQDILLSNRRAERRNKRFS